MGGFRMDYIRVLGALNHKPELEALWWVTGMCL